MVFQNDYESFQLPRPKSQSHSPAHLTVEPLLPHTDEILDVCYNSSGSKLVTASADGTSRVYNTMTGACQAILIGHEGEISKVCYNPQGTKILTASSDKSARLWEVETGECLQV